MTRRHLPLWVALLAVSAGPALAVAPPGDVPPGVVALPGQKDRVLDRELQRRMSEESVELAAFRDLHGDWRVAVWDELTGTPDRAFGEPIQLLDGRVDETTVVDAARAFVADHAAFFGVDVSDLTLRSVRRGRDIYYVQLQQTFGGVDIYDGRVLLRIDTAGRLVSFGADVYPDVASNPFARLAEHDAIANAAEGLPWDASRDVAELARRVILPIHGEDRVDYVTTHEVFLDVEGTRWVSYVNAETGSVVWRESTTRHANIIGDVKGEVVAEDPFGPTYDGAMWHQEVTASPSGVSGETIEDGSFDILYGGVDVQTLGLDFVSGNGHFNVNNVQVADAVMVESVTPGVFESLYWDDSNSQQQERVPFHHLQRQREDLIALDGGFPFLVDPVNVLTNVNGTCNATWSGTTINLYREGGGCIASGRIPSVAAHEYGHGLSDWQYGPALPCALIEAFPDIHAMYYTEQPQIGTALFGAGQVLRDGRNTLTWSQAVSGCPNGGYPSGECHCKADVTMGAAWKVRENMVDKYGEVVGHAAAENAVHFAIYSSASTPQLFVTDVLEENDDDGNLANGTPDYNQICAAFELHGLPCPSLTQFITITHDPLDDTVNTTTPYEVVADIEPTNETLDASSLLVTYRVNGGSWQSVSMTATGNPDEYQADIPAQGAGEYVDYYISASGLGGAQAQSPVDAPFLDVHRFGIGLFAVDFLDEMESDNGWSLSDPGDDAIAGFWVRDDPNGTTLGGQPANPEDDATVDPGTDCYFTGQGTPGGSVAAADIDGGCTTLISPTLDLSSTTFARIAFKRWWYSNGGSDALTIEISTDGGGSWSELESVSGIENAWNEVSFDVTASDYDMTATTLVRFVACDIATASVTEAGVDDMVVSLLTTDVTAVGSDVAIGRFRVEQNRPNPFNPTTTIRYEVARNEHVSLRIYNVAGQLVRTLVDGIIDAGVHDVVWDGTSQGGREVASGTYYYRMVAGETEIVRPMTLLK